MSMAHGLEVRVPLVDHTLVELVLSLEDRWKIDSRMPKPLLVKAVEAATGAPIPSAVVHRAKRGFAFPFETWLRGPLGSRVRDALCSHGTALDGFLDRTARGQVWRDFDEGRTTWSRPWALYALGRWAEMHLNRLPALARLG
jgi:asparagine synthase (glutamine-hydrolysing)